MVTFITEWPSSSIFFSAGGTNDWPELCFGNQRMEHPISIRLISFDFRPVSCAIFL